MLLGLVLALAQFAVVEAEEGRASVVGMVSVEQPGASGTTPAAQIEVRLIFGSKSETRLTGPDGSYRFADLLPGKYTVRVVTPDGYKVKGDGSLTLTLDERESARADFRLIAPAPAKPTAAAPAPAAAPKPSPAPAAQPVAGAPQAQPGAPPKPVAAAPSSPPAAIVQPSQVAAAVTPRAEAAPPVVMPYPSASPGPAGPPAQPVAGAPSSEQAAVAVASPAPLLFATPAVLIAASPVPQASPTPDAPPEEVLANTPPRRLITSFEMLRERAGGAAAADLRTYVTDSSLLLGVPFRTQIDGSEFSLVNCGPASLAMVLAAFGLDVDPPSVRDYLNFLVGNYDPETGTSLYVLANIAREAGLNVFGTSSGFQGWTVEAVREQIRAGHPVITLTKYRRLPGHFGSQTDFDHYIVITGLAGEDFVYNDAAYATEYGYNLLISPAELERAWADSSVPRHAVAIGLGDSLRPLPFVPRRLTAESLAAPSEALAADPRAVVRPVRGLAAERLREQMLDELGARTAVIDGEPVALSDLTAPPTRLDPAEVASQLAQSVPGQPIGDVDHVDALAGDPAEAAAVPPAAPTEAAAGPAAGSAPVDGAAGSPVADGAQAAPGGPGQPLGLALAALGLTLTVGGGVAALRRRAGGSLLRRR